MDRAPLPEVTGLCSLGGSLLQAQVARLKLLPVWQPAPIQQTVARSFHCAGLGVQNGATSEDPGSRVQGFRVLTWLPRICSMLPCALASLSERARPCSTAGILSSGRLIADEIRVLPAHAGQGRYFVYVQTPGMLGAWARWHLDLDDCALTHGVHAYIA